MKLALLSLSIVLSCFWAAITKAQVATEHGSSTKLAAEIKQLLDNYSSALKDYKGAAITDTTEKTVHWFRCKKEFSRATHVAIEEEDGSNSLVLNFEGFNKDIFVIGFGKQIKALLTSQEYAFGKLKEIASGEEGLLELTPENATGKFMGIHILIHIPNQNGLKDKFGKQRKGDVVMRIDLPSKTGKG